MALEKIEARKIWDEVKENLRKLRACAKHRFAEQPVKIGQKVECLNCGGKMGLISIGDYIAGYKAAGGSVDDIWPNYEGNRNAVG